MALSSHSTFNSVKAFKSISASPKSSMSPARAQLVSPQIIPQIQLPQNIDNYSQSTESNNSGNNPFHRSKTVRRSLANLTQPNSPLSNTENANTNQLNKQKQIIAELQRLLNDEYQRKSQTDSQIRKLVIASNKTKQENAHLKRLLKQLQSNNINTNTNQAQTIEIKNEYTKSKYVLLYENGTLNPNDLEHSLQTMSALFKENTFVPHSQGLPYICISCNHWGQIPVIKQSINAICEFILKFRKYKPLQLICQQRREMHWRIDYTRKDWMHIIEKTQMDIFAEDMSGEASFWKIIAMIDVFNLANAKMKWDVYYTKISHSISQTTQTEMKSDIDISEIKDVIKFGGFYLSPFDCRLWCIPNIHKMSHKISLEKEINAAFEMANILKFHSNALFKHLQFGYDFEIKASFIEMKPKTFFLLFDGDKEKFMKCFQKVANSRFRETEQKLCISYTSKRVTELMNYANHYFHRSSKLTALF